MSPTEPVCASSKIGFQVVPLLSVFQTPPDPTATYHWLSSCGLMAMSAMRPDMKAHAVQEIVFELGCVSGVAEECPVGAITYSRMSHET
mgnify:CR=1 FL=1